MAEFPALQLWTDAYLADCDHLTDAEHGRYLLLLMHMWRAPKRRFPNDDEWLARKFRRSVEQVRTELRPLLAEFFQTTGNWLWHKRLEREFVRLQERSARQSERAKSRWEKEKDECRGTANGIATTTTTTTYPESDSESDSLPPPPTTRARAPENEGGADAPVVGVEGAARLENVGHEERRRARDGVLVWHQEREPRTDLASIGRQYDQLEQAVADRRLFLSFAEDAPRRAKRSAIGTLDDRVSRYLAGIAVARQRAESSENVIDAVYRENGWTRD